MLYRPFVHADTWWHSPPRHITTEIAMLPTTRCCPAFLFPGSTSRVQGSVLVPRTAARDVLDGLTVNGRYHHHTIGVGGSGDCFFFATLRKQHMCAGVYGMVVL